MESPTGLPDYLVGDCPVRDPLCEDMEPPFGDLGLPAKNHRGPRIVCEDFTLLAILRTVLPSGSLLAPSNTPGVAVFALMALSVSELFRSREPASEKL